MLYSNTCKKQRCLIKSQKEKENKIVKKVVISGIIVILVIFGIGMSYSCSGEEDVLRKSRRSQKRGKRGWKI